MKTQRGSKSLSLILKSVERQIQASSYPSDLRKVKFSTIQRVKSLITYLYTKHGMFSTTPNVDRHNYDTNEINLCWSYDFFEQLGITIDGEGGIHVCFDYAGSKSILDSWDWPNLALELYFPNLKAFKKLFNSNLMEKVSILVQQHAQNSLGLTVSDFIGKVMGWDLSKFRREAYP